MKSSSMRNKTAKTRKKPINQTKNMKSSFMMSINKKKGKRRDQRRVVIHEEEKRNKFKKTKKYCSINKSFKETSKRKQKHRRKNIRNKIMMKNFL